MARMVHCVKLGKEAEGLDYPPFPGELGKRIWLNVSKEAWGELNLADLSARKHLMSQCERYFFGDGKTGDLPNYTPKA